jgi:hypothetical protein
LGESGRFGEPTYQRREVSLLGSGQYNRRCATGILADVLGVFEGIQISIDVPLGYNRRDQLLQFMQSKFPGASFSIVHCEVSDPTVSEALVQHDFGDESAKTETTAPVEHSESVLTKASDALSAFAKSTV